MTADSLLFSGAVACIVVGLGALGALVSMQRRLCELKTELDNTKDALRESRRHEGDALACLEDAERRARLADQQERRGFEHVQLAYPADALPDLPTEPLDADPWVAEMRHRWIYDSPLTSEDEY